MKESVVKRSAQVSLSSAAKGTKVTPASVRPITHEEVALRAYQLFEQSDRRPGNEVENWLRAEAELTGRRSATTLH